MPQGYKKSQQLHWHLALLALYRTAGTGADHPQAFASTNNGIKAAEFVQAYVLFLEDWIAQGWQTIFPNIWHDSGIRLWENVFH